jgi:hypothetical protein
MSDYLVITDNSLAPMCNIRSDLVIVIQGLLRVIWIEFVVVLRLIGTLHAMLSTDPLFQKLVMS